MGLGSPEVRHVPGGIMNGLLVLPPELITPLDGPHNHTPALTVGESRADDRTKQARVHVAIFVEDYASDAGQRYAFEREADHLWTLGETDKARESLWARTSPVPRDNLRRWRPWLPQIEATF